MRILRFAKLILYGTVFNFLLTNCTPGVQSMRKIFTGEEIATLDSLIGFFDHYVQARSVNIPDIQKAYLRFLEEHLPVVKESGDWNAILPPHEERFAFYETLDPEVLGEIFHVSDSVTVHYPGEAASVTMHSPWHFTLNYEGKFVRFLEELGRENRFFQRFYDQVMICGDICPTIYDQIMNHYAEIDFGSKDQRLALIVSLLRINPVMKVPQVQDDLQSFWKLFRKAVLDNDTIKLMELTRFPLDSHGRLDSDPQPKISQSDFLYYFRISMTEHTGRSREQETNLDHLKRTEQLDSDKYVTIHGDWCRVTSMDFRKTDDGWKLTRIYFDTAKYR